jgi:hypothetical protein
VSIYGTTRTMRTGTEVDWSARTVLCLRQTDNIMVMNTRENGNVMGDDRNRLISDYSYVVQSWLGYNNI